MDENLKLATNLLSEFDKALPNRSGFFLSYEVLKPLLRWRFNAWENEMKLLGRAAENLDSWSDYYQLLLTINNIFVGIEKKILTDNSIESYSFFDALEKHVNEHIKSTVLVKENDERFYVEDLLNTFFGEFFKSANKARSYSTIWDSYPSAWKIRSSTVLNSIPQKVALGNFLDWATSKLNAGKEYDSELDTTAAELFPEVDPIQWAAILTYALAPVGPEGKIKYVIEKPWIFGNFGRIQSFSFEGAYDEGELEDRLKRRQETAYKAESKSTIQLALELRKIVPAFYFAFSPDAIKVALDEAEKLIYPADSRELRKKQRLVSILKEILDASLETSASKD